MTTFSGDKNLSKSDMEVLRYIQQETKEGQENLSESMKSISKKLGISEATVHRAVSKLTQYGYIGVIPSTNKYKSNLIVYYGDPVAPENISEEPFFNMLMQFNQRANRFKNILEMYQQEYETLKTENEQLKQGIIPDSMKNDGERFIMYNDQKICESDIIGQTALNDELIAYIVKKK